MQLLGGPAAVPAGARRQPALDAAQLLQQTYQFYQQQLARFPEARAYLAWRGIHEAALIAGMGIGHDPNSLFAAGAGAADF